MDINLNAFFAAIDLSSAAPGSIIVIYNYGKIIGVGGVGGHGRNTYDPECIQDDFLSSWGGNGGPAITSMNGTKLKIFNYDFIAGGGGGGGGGAGAGYGGARGFHFYYDFESSCWPEYDNSDAEFGNPGLLASGGGGGKGGGGAGSGGNGGNLGSPGQSGSNGVNNGGNGGQPGKAISGNPGNNNVINCGSGVVIGVVE